MRTTHFQIYETVTGCRWRWVRNEDGVVLAASKEYETIDQCREALKALIDQGKQDIATNDIEIVPYKSEEK